MSKNLVALDQGTLEDQQGRRKKPRVEELRSGTLHGQYNLRGSILVLKDNLNPVSGFLSFGTDIATAPTTASTGSGLFIDYTGLGLLLSNTTLVRTGNLNGTYGYVTDVYGFATGQYGVAGKVSVTIDQTNGIRFILNTTVIAQWDLSGNILIGDSGAGDPNLYLSAGEVKIRVGTQPIVTLNASGISTDKAFGFSPVSVTVPAGDVDLDDGGNGVSGTLYTSYIHITAAAGDFTINSIANPAVRGQHLKIQNHSAHKMTVRDNGAPLSAAYNNVRTHSGIPDIHNDAGGGIVEVLYNIIDDRYDVASFSPGWTT